MEFAFVLPVLLTLILGVIDYGLALSAQTRVSAAAREGVRAMAVGGTVAEARAAAKVAATGVPLTDAQMSISPTTCAGTAAGTSVTVTITYPYTLVTGFFGTSITLNASGVMRCEG